MYSHNQLLDPYWYLARQFPGSNAERPTLKVRYIAYSKMTAINHFGTNFTNNTIIIV